ncbi:MAG: Imm17 family immunity protein [Hominimerdicola sp.]
MKDYFIMALVMFAVGLFTLISSLKEAKWFFENRKAKPFVDMFGFKGAKIFYIILGIIFILLGFVPVIEIFREL